VFRGLNTRRGADFT